MRTIASHGSFPCQIEDRLFDAMHYATLGGGKRIRPLLLLQTCTCLGIDPQEMRYVAAAVEMVHCYSLVHDDLPAMDDDDVRRNRPTVHKKFDEATAILAGDALLSMGFYTIVHPD
ncbi:MAG: polyprenyl synthetase family protein, partial [Pseudomonadota bacterium]